MCIPEFGELFLGQAGLGLDEGLVVGHDDLVFKRGQM